MMIWSQVLPVLQFMKRLLSEMTKRLLWGIRETCSPERGTCHVDYDERKEGGQKLGSVGSYRKPTKTCRCWHSAKAQLAVSRD